MSWEAEYKLMHHFRDFIPDNVDVQFVALQQETLNYEEERLCHPIISC